MVVAGDDSEEKRMYSHDNNSGGHGSGSVVPIKKAEESRLSNEVSDHSVVPGKKNSGLDVGQGSRPRMHTQDPSNNAALAVSVVPLPHTPSSSPEDATSVNTRIPSIPPSSPPSSPPSPSSPIVLSAPTVLSAPSSSFVTQYSEPVVIPPGHVWLAGDSHSHLTAHSSIITLLYRYSTQLRIGGCIHVTRDMFRCLMAINYYMINFNEQILSYFHSLSLISDSTPLPPPLIPPSFTTTGDNVNNSTDSRFYGPVPTGLLRGRVFTKLRWGLWPFEMIKSSNSVVTTSTTSSPSNSSISKG